MSLIKAIKQQLGMSTTPANNFTLDASADNGTMKLARGNAGATTQDIMTVDAAGKPDFPQLARSIGATGSYTLPGGLIIKWGISTVTTGTPLAVTFATAFPTTTVAITTGLSSPSSAVNTVYISTFANSGMTLNVNGNAGASNVHWIAIGY